MSSLTFHERQHLERLLKQQGSVKYVFDEFTRKVGVHMQGWTASGSGDLWLKNAKVQKAIDGELKTLHSKLVTNIESYSSDAWKASHTKVDDLVDNYIKDMPLSKLVKDGMFARNAEALNTFLKRKADGLTISDRVWNVTGTAKQNIEMYLESGLATGRSASLISQDIRQVLKDPDRRFHRIRNADGKLVPSAPMKAYHPGQGVYRSSYKNALRLAVTNTNEIYRATDCERWNGLDFVLGIEIKRSASTSYGNCVICDPLAGKYPKDYVFKGWHPFCICFSVPILMDEDNFIDGLVGDKMPTDGMITDIPSKSRKYFNDQLAKKNVSTNSYLFKDNKKFFDGSLKKASVVKPKVAPIKVQPKAAVPAPAPVVSSSIPASFKKGAPYVKDTGIVFKDEFFALVDKEQRIGLTVMKSGKKGSYFNPSSKSVHIADGRRNAASAWHKEAVIYHEYGHAIDWQRGMRANISDRLNAIRKDMNKASGKVYTGTKYDYKKGEYVEYQKKISKVADTQSRLGKLNTEIWHMSPEAFVETKYAKAGLTKTDVLEQLGSTMDTLMSVNPNYGRGHTKAYFKGRYKREAEFIAHSFENKFAGNMIFKETMPELYDEMIKLIEGLQPIQ